MLTKERFFRILELLDHKSFITIQELMEVLNASKSTVNRDPVSYTHLDVYKRQVLHCACMNDIGQKADHNTTDKESR